MKEQLKKRQLMKKQLYFLCALALTATFTLNGCKNNPQQKETATEKIDGKVRQSRTLLSMASVAMVQ